MPGTPLSESEIVPRLAAAVAKDRPWGFPERRRRRIAEEVLSVAYPIIRDEVGATLLAECIEASEAQVRADVIAEVVAALRKAAQAEYKGRGLGERAADFIEREFGGTNHA